MVMRLIIWLTFLRAMYCYPNRQHFTLPDLDVSTPEEVNSLEQEEPLRRSIDPQTAHNNNIQDTVTIVEEIIKSNPALPRLTRGEILDLLENITTTDEGKKTVLGLNRKPKAVMVVMPYTPDKDNDIEDLYTKAPITQIIGAEPFRTKEEANIEKHNRRRPVVQYSDADNDLAQKTLPVEEKKKYSASISTKPAKASPSRTQVRRKRPEATTEVVPTTELIPATYRPTTYYSSTTSSRRPMRRRTTTTTTTTTTAPITIRTTTQEPAHLYTEKFVSNSGMRIIESPKLTLPKRFDDFELDFQENVKQEVVVTPDPISSFVTKKPTRVKTTTPKFKLAKPFIDDISFHQRIHHLTAPVVPSIPNIVKSTTPTLLTEDINFPDSLKPVVKDLNLEGAISPESEQLTLKIEEQNIIKHLLASIGIFPPNPTTTTTTTIMPNAEVVVDSLSPDMRDLLMSFGLLPNPNKKPVQGNTDRYNPEKAEVHPESYIGFKPLPEDGPNRDDMDALLASFGLGRSARREKSINVDKIDDEKTFTFDMIPENFKDVVKDLGIDDVHRESKHTRSTKAEDRKDDEKDSEVEEEVRDEQLEQVNRDAKRIRTPELEKTIEKQHVFNPDAQFATDEELQKLERLMNVIKQLEKLNGTATDEDLKKIDLESLKELVTSLNFHNETLESLEEQENSPDPTTFDVGVAKNEVKRQEDSTTAASTTEEATTASTTSTTAEPEAETPSLKDLEASFGGQIETATLPPIPETTTKRTGFYYLVDWNTFLDIDDTKGKRVNLRFQPTIGDPKRFLSVSVP